ncbi:hypothetical protein GCM10022224_035550 [Nonomuraea antimicrobica]|uniref:Transposase IS701-like DDE domain-containing protein n=1 Tax=Nonomuraea antimicrobica TaxID=561173 RepID=A0ABP7BRK0_9ACTN
MGDRSPDATQRLLNRAPWDTPGAVSTIRRFAVTPLDTAARPGSLTVGALDELCWNPVTRSHRHRAHHRSSTNEWRLPC